MKQRLSELFSRLTHVDHDINQIHGVELITAIEEHQKASFYERHLPITRDRHEQQLLSFYSDIVNQGLDSKAVLKTSKKIELVEKTLRDKTPILIPLELHVLISELNLSIAQHISSTAREGTKKEINEFITTPANYAEKRAEILTLLDTLSQYIVELLNDEGKIKMLKKSRLLFKTLGLSYFYEFISEYLRLLENVSGIAALNTAIISNERNHLNRK